MGQDHGISKPKGEKRMHVDNEIQDKSVEEKLLAIKLFVRAFALAGDIKACSSYLCVYSTEQ